MGFLPRAPLFRDDTKGDACPPLESPAGLLNILPDDGYSRRCVVRTMFRQAPIETCIPLRGRQAEYRRPPDYRLDKKTIFSGRAVSSLIQTNWEKESKTLVLAVFRFTFGRPKVTPGVWGRVVPTRPEPRGAGVGNPRKNPGPGWGGPTCYRIEWQLFGRRNVSSPPARRWANLSPSVPRAGTERKQQGRPPCERQNFPLTFYRQIW